MSDVNQKSTDGVMTRSVDLGPNTRITLGVACSVLGIVLVGAWFAFNANAKIGVLQASTESASERSVRVEAKVDRIADEWSSAQRDIYIRLAKIEAKLEAGGK